MKNKVLYLFLWTVVFSWTSAQEKTIDTVYVFDKQADNIHKNQYIQRISPQEIRQNSTNLSEVLRFQTNVYIKENGRGMTSSPSFRGTTAQQTAFVWNGINLNSVFLGQGDINNLALLSYDDIEVKAGGGSVIYGSGAIGGSVHLNNHLLYKKGTKAQLFLEGGSFKTFNSQLKTNYSNGKFSMSVGANYTTSKNDYEVEEKHYKNENGAYKNKGVNLGLGYKINLKNQISALYHWDDGEQYFPIFETTQTKTKYQTQNQRLLTAWDFKNQRIKNTFNVAFLQEEFDYFANINQPRSSGGVGKTFLMKDDFKFKINPYFRLNFLTQFRQEKGEGYQSGIQNSTRNTGFITSLLNYQKGKLNLDFGIKKEWDEREKAPFLYSFLGKYKVSKIYTFALNASKNYRAPTFNDLYWNPGGNLNLKSEISHQIGMEHSLKMGKFQFHWSPYYIYIRDMIRWLPTSNGYWSPVNTNKVASYGFEMHLTWEHQWQDFGTKLKIGYAFTNSKNLETKKMLSYVPQHQINVNANIDYKRFSLLFQARYNGRTFTDTNENKRTAIGNYFITNLGLKAKINRLISLGFKVNNVTKTIYETTAYYPLPKRNYSLYFNVTM